MRDMLNVPIEPGVTLAYPGRKGARQWLHCMRVLDVRPGRVSGLLPTGRATTIRRLDQAVVVVGGVL